MLGFVLVNKDKVMEIFST